MTLCHANSLEAHCILFLFKTSYIFQTITTCRSHTVNPNISGKDSTCSQRSLGSESSSDDEVSDIEFESFEEIESIEEEPESNVVMKVN